MGLWDIYWVAAVTSASGLDKSVPDIAVSPWPWRAAAVGELQPGAGVSQEVGCRLSGRSV